MKTKKSHEPRKKRPIPFSFILDYLYPIEPVIKPMFGCSALYVDDKIVMILRERINYPQINGIWIATERQHHDSLKKVFPSMCSIDVLGEDPTNWQMIPVTADDFESSAIQLCKLIKQRDERIGKVPKKKRKKIMR